MLQLALEMRNIVGRTCFFCIVVLKHIAHKFMPCPLSLVQINFGSILEKEVKNCFPMGVPTTRVISDFTTLICGLVLEAKGF